MFLHTPRTRAGRPDVTAGPARGQLHDPLPLSTARDRSGSQDSGRPGFRGRIAAERRPVILERVEHGLVLNPLLPQRGIRSLVGVPLVVLTGPGVSPVVGAFAGQPG
jgi:hypothetical protein